jgi:predicted AlkP superfamily phosphohydrolase/phosphomutase
MADQAGQLFVIGWDAATWDLLESWVQSGELPNLKQMMEAGSSGPLKSTPMPLSPAAWSTVITGQNPARHGVYDWFERIPDSYDVEYVHTGQLRAKPFWEYFNEAGKRVGVVNLPMIYPAVSLDGFMLSGMAAPHAHARNFAYPSGLTSELEERFGPYWVAEPEIYKYGHEGAFLQSMLDWIDYQGRILQYLIQEHPCDVYLFVFMQTDHVQHKYWRYLDSSYPGYDPSHDIRYQGAILQVYQRVDKVLGDLMSSVHDDATFVLLSDHGAGPVHGIMFINRWLMELGLLHLRGNLLSRIKYGIAKFDLVMHAYRVLVKLGLAKVVNLISKPARNRVLNSFIGFDDIDWSRTKAYSRGAFGQIYVNLRGREPLGIVEPGEEYDRLVEEIITHLDGLTHPESGSKLITGIHKREDVYAGPYLDKAADVVFSIQNYKYQASVKFGLESHSIIGSSEYDDSGSHRPEGIFVMAGSGVQRGINITGVGLEDILPTLLALADLPIPKNMDGMPLLDVLTPECAAQIQYLPTDDSGQDQSEAPDLDAGEKVDLEDRLRSLGYLG